MKKSQRYSNIGKPLCILTIPKSKTNLKLKMTMTLKSFCKPTPDGPQWIMGRQTDVLMRSASIGPVRNVQQRRNMNVKKTSQRDMCLQTDAFLRSTERPLRIYMDFILFILWKYSGKAFDLCEFWNEHLEAFSYIKQRKVGIQLNL